MHKISQRILLAFKEFPSNEISTSQILDIIEPEYSKIKKKIKKEHERERILKYKREAAKLHRKILWHLSKLVSQGLLRVNRYGEKGKKFFSLNISDNEEIITEVSKIKTAEEEDTYKNKKDNIDVYKRKIVISKPFIPAMPIDGFEQKKILFKYEPGTWIDRLNSVVIFAEHFESLDKLYEAINLLFSNINDALCIVDFDKFFAKETIESLVNFTEKINSDCEDYGKKISLMLNIKKLREQKKLFFKFIDIYKKKGFKDIYIIFNTNSKEVLEEKSFFEKLIYISSKTKISFFIKNKDIYQAPYFIGRAGPYCIDEKEWELTKEELKKNKILACTQSSVLIDIGRFIKEYDLKIDRFLSLITNIAKALFSANSLQRRRSEEYFKNIVNLNSPQTTEFLMVARNYIRLWNYNLSDEEKEKFLIMMSMARKKVDEFSAAEETIYKSCGMSMRFKIAFACAFKEATEELSKEAYQKLEIKNIEDLHKKETKKDLKAREILGEIFNGGNRVSVYRKGKIDTEEIIEEIVFLLNNYKIPFFIYNFKNIKGNLKLTSFFNHTQKT